MHATAAMLPVAGTARGLPDPCGVHLKPVGGNFSIL
jgi:hypothetical protein